MSGSPKERLETDELAEAREVYLRDGRKLVVSDAGSDQLVEIKSSSGLVELRIRLTEEGPVLQLESVRLQLKAAEAIELESKTIALKATERLELSSEGDLEVDAKGEVRVVGKMIYLN
jgi:hypothetical protein